MQHSRKHFANKTIFLSGFVVCLLTLFFFGQKSASQTQSSETKRDKPELVVQTGHTERIESVKFSPDGKILASDSYDRTITLWNVETGQQIKSFVSSGTGTVEFSPNGKILATDIINAIVLYDIESGQPIKSFEGNSPIAFSPDGKNLVATSKNRIKLWNIETEKFITFSIGHTKDIADITFSPDGEIIASGSFDNTVKLWNSQSGQIIKSLNGFSDYVKDVAFSPNGKILAYAGTFGDVIKFWDIESGQFTKSLEGHGYSIDSIAFSQNGKIFASVGGIDNVITLWDVETRNVLKSFVGSATMIFSIAFSPDGKYIASGGLDNTVRLWDLETLKLTKTLANRVQSVNSVALSPDGKIIATASNEKTIKLWSIELGQPILTLSGHTEPINSIAFSPDGKVVVSGSSDMTIKIWDVATGKLTQTLEDNISSVDSVIFSPDGKFIASSSINNLNLWNAKTGKLINNIEAKADWICSILFSPDSKTLAYIECWDGNSVQSWRKPVKLFDIQSGQIIMSLANHPKRVYEIAFSPDGKYLASGSEDETIKLWNVKTAQLIKTFEGHTSYISSIIFSPDGKTLISGSNNGVIKIWNIELGKQISSLTEHSNSVTEIFYLKNEKNFVSSSLDGTVKIWNINNNKSLATLISLDKDRWIITTPDGRFDTNEDLNKIEGLIWVLPDQPLIPKPLELYMRQYYEPGLLPRVLRCAEENNCEQEFKPLPSIAEINRVQPHTEIKEIRAKANDGGLVDVVVEVESRTEEIAGKKIESGAFDLRLFRDGQIVGTSAKQADLEEYIHLAPALVEKDRSTKTLLNTEEDKAWRKANDLNRVVKFDKNKATFVFENVRLPQDGRKQVEFLAYAFNDDRVKSDTSRKTFEIKSPSQRAGNTYLVSIGVNASENPAYNLNYAAVDARKTQEILGDRLKAKLKGTGSKLIQINLVSDNQTNEKTATKPIIKSMFNRLAGKTGETLEFPVTIDGQKISADKLPAVQPEDTLIITYSGHGYADANGIFYLLPYDIGATTEKLTTEVLPRLISSDELSLWMRDVTAREMLMIVDACHSAAAVQGDGFKPGPMASRGLGQLAYDKGMKILSATQANNVALELGGSLKQGLLSYALLQDGIFDKLADTDSNKQLFYREWLKYGEKRVPALYEGIKNGTIKSVTIDGKPPTVEQRSGIFYVDKNRKQTLQEPKLFDFNEKRDDVLLINLP